MGETTLRQALDDYKTIYMPYRNFADRTRVEYQNDLEDFAKHLRRAGVESVAGIGLRTIERYLANLEEKGFSSRTRKRKTVAIRSFFSFLYQDGYIGTNIAARVVLPFTENATPHVLTHTECDRLRSACAGTPRDAAIFELLLQTGLRLSELTRLTLSDIELCKKGRAGQEDNGYIRISGGRARIERLIPLNSRACGALTYYLKAANGTRQSILFPNRFGGPLGDRGVQKMLRKYLKSAGIGKASIHTLRHTYAARHIAKGESLRTIQDSMGLKDPRSTSIYASFVNNKEVGA